MRRASPLRRHHAQSPHRPALASPGCHAACAPAASPHLLANHVIMVHLVPLPQHIRALLLLRLRLGRVGDLLDITQGAGIRVPPLLRAVLPGPCSSSGSGSGESAICRTVAVTAGRSGGSSQQERRRGRRRLGRLRPQANGPGTRTGKSFSGCSTRRQDGTSLAFQGGIDGSGKFCGMRRW